MIRTVADLTSFKWATITSVDPIRIKLDGDSEPLALTPESLIHPRELVVKDRVRVELSRRTCIIHGAFQGGILKRTAN